MKNDVFIVSKSPVHPCVRQFPCHSHEETITERATDVERRRSSMRRGIEKYCVPADYTVEALTQGIRLGKGFVAEIIFFTPKRTVTRYKLATLSTDIHLLKASYVFRSVR